MVMVDQQRYTDVVFDGPPGPESGRFVEVEDQDGWSVNVGTWVCRPDGYWVLRLPIPHDRLTDGARSRRVVRVEDALAAVAAIYQEVGRLERYLRYGKHAGHVSMALEWAADFLTREIERTAEDAW